MSSRGDASPLPLRLAQAAELGTPLYLVADAEAHAHLLSWGCTTLHVPLAMERIEPTLLAGSLVVILRDLSSAQQRWAERLALYLADAKLVVKVMVADASTVAAWLKSIGSLANLADLETLTPRFELPKERSVKAADWMVSYALENSRLSTTSLGEPYLRFSVGQIVRTAKLSSREVSDYLLSAYYDAFTKTPPDEAIRTARATLGMHARLHGERAEAFIRVGHAHGCIYLDLGGPDWASVEVNRAMGWRVVTDAPVVFSRPSDLAEMPRPATRAGTSYELARAGFDVLRQYVFLPDGEMYLLWGFLVFCFHPTGPYPHLSFVGGQNTGKTVVTELVRSIIDPATRSKTRSMPTCLRDLAIATRGTYVLAFDNLSHLSERMSDALCRLSTGFGHSERRLTTDDEEEIFYAIRPVLSNGIVDIVEREDLASRTFTLHLKRPDPPVDLETLWHRFHDDHPVLLAGLLECVWMATLTGGTTDAPAVTRMLAFERWAAQAASLAGGDEGAAAFRRALASNQRDARMEAADNDPFVLLLRRFLEPRTTWRGTMTELLGELLVLLPDPNRPPVGIPQNAQALSAKITRKLPTIEAVGLSVVDEGLHGPSQCRKRLYSLALSSSE